jgi:hypothetical protein
MKILGAAICAQPAAIEVLEFPRENKATIPLPSVFLGKAPKDDGRSTGLSVHMGTNENTSIALMSESIAHTDRGRSDPRQNM